MDSASPKWRSEKMEIWKVEFGVILRGGLGGRMGIARVLVREAVERSRRRVVRDMVGGRIIE